MYIVARGFVLKSKLPRFEEEEIPDLANKWIIFLIRRYARTIRNIN